VRAADELRRRQVEPDLGLPARPPTR
jgi:hypothetical protein